MMAHRVLANEQKQSYYLIGMATVFLTNFIRCRTSFRMLFRLSLTMSLLVCFLRFCCKVSILSTKVPF
ncbi:hypothetical protein EQV91_15000 (plasmid) [Enterococcus faecium]|nr:hypothetical protein CI258_012850 [Enterococcus faecium]QAT24462.1 hypothetical protein EQV91_15000 [Enterococcus faecium]